MARLVAHRATAAAAVSKGCMPWHQPRFKEYGKFQPRRALCFPLSLSIFVLVELAWENTNNHTEGSNHGTH